MGRVRAGVVDQTVQPAIPFYGPVDDPLDLVGIADIARFEVALAGTLRRQFGRQRLAGFAAAGTDDDRRAGRTEDARAALANSFAAAGYQADFIEVLCGTHAMNHLAVWRPAKPGI